MARRVRYTSCALPRTWLTTMGPSGADTSVAPKLPPAAGLVTSISRNPSQTAPTQ
jgi:hypothetical protein